MKRVNIAAFCFVLLVALTIIPLILDLGSPVKVTPGSHYDWHHLLVILIFLLVPFSLGWQAANEHHERK